MCTSPSCGTGGRGGRVFKHRGAEPGLLCCCLRRRWRTELWWVFPLFVLLFLIVVYNTLYTLYHTLYHQPFNPNSFWHRNYTQNMQRSAFAGSLQATAWLASLASWWGHRFSLYLIHFLISPFLNLVFLTFTSSLAGKSSFLLHLTFSICCISPVSFFLSLFQTRTVTFASAMETPMLDTTSTFSSLSFFLHFHFSLSLSSTFAGGEQGGPWEEPSAPDQRRVRPRGRVRGEVHRDVAGDGTPHWWTARGDCDADEVRYWGQNWVLYDRARFRLRENNAHSRQPQATIKETVKGFFNLLAGKGDEKRKSCRNLNIWRPRKARGCWQYSYISHITEIMIISRIKYYRDDAYVKLLNYFTSAFCIFLVANAINSH